MWGVGEKRPAEALALAGVAERLTKNAGLDAEYAKALYWKSFLINQQ